MDLHGTQALVVGTGVSGIAAARLLRRQGRAVDLYDDAPRERLGPAALELETAGAGIIGDAGLHPERYDLAVVSPGVPRDAAVLQRLEAAGVELVGEVELAFRGLAAPLLAVTGTNGKTTTVELLGKMLAAAGRKVFVGGNLGTPLCAAVDGAWDLVVAEISSFQLETVHSFRPHVALLLNLSADHLERHRDMAEYAQAKARLFANQTREDTAIVNADDPAAWEIGRRVTATLLPYSLERPLSAGAWLEGNDVVVLLPGQDGVRLSRGQLQLPGEHNLGNALAACLAAARVGVDPALAWGVAQRFRGLAHRVETFLEWQGVRFVDDSKATNVDAALRALETVPGRIVWVAGGVDKGGAYEPLVPLLRERGRRVVLVGEAAPKIAAAVGDATPLQVSADWHGAVRAAVGAAQPGDTVLLSPACSSFDFFSGYAQRGETFQRLCREETARRAADGH